MAEANIPLQESSSDEEQVCQNSDKMSLEESTDQSMQKFLEKSRSELMFELRKLQHGDRPVTGQGRQEVVDSFFSKRLQVAASNSEHENRPSNVDNVEEHRPEAVVVEVQGLYEQHRVSAVLQSQQFRRQLENVIRHSIGGAPRRPRPVAPPRRRVPIPEQSSLNNVRQDIVRPDDNTSTDETEDWSDNEDIPSPAPRRNISQSGNHNNSPPPSRSEDVSVPDVRPEAIRPDATRPPISWNQITAVQQDEMIDEIRELLHHRLVSETLNGEFRGTLEVTMQDRVPDNGEEVAEFVRSLERTQPVRRNDFSHLGIPDLEDHHDNISVTSLSATAVPYTHSNLHLSREISSLKSQINEMKNMMKLSFDLQMDIQRSIRQEVSAAINNALGGTTSAPVIPESRPVRDDRCVICLENFSDSVLYQCGHMCLCYTCGRDLMNRGHNCPVCRAPIRDIIKAYRSNRQ